MTSLAKRTTITPRPYYAVTLPYQCYPDSDYGAGEEGCDVVAVMGRTKHEAKVAAVRAFRKMGARGIEWSENPFGQFTLEAADCEHGLAIVEPEEDASDFRIIRGCPICDVAWAYFDHMDDQLEPWEQR